MALEAATFINTLDAANPSPTDLIGQGDDHIRLLKAVLKATFPNFTGAPINLTEAQINSFAASVSSAAVPIGMIALWYGSTATVPLGYAICNGQTVARSDAGGNIICPDLRDKVAMGAGTLALTGVSYGAASASATTSSAGGHTHLISGGGTHGHPGAVTTSHVLSLAEIPSHNHIVGIGDDQTTTFTRGFNNASTAGTQNLTTNAGSTPYEPMTSSSGGGLGHYHDMSFTGLDGTHTHTSDTITDHAHGVTVPTYQPALALHYIMKV